MSEPAGDLLPWLDGLLAAGAVGIAVWLRPWRRLPRSGPPWPWLLAWSVLPLLWGLDHYVSAPILRPMSGAVLLVLLAGWPITMLAVGPAALVAALVAHLDVFEGLQRMVWLGVVPATLALALGGASRRWLPRHLFVYILVRCFMGTLLACALAGWLLQALRAPPTGTSSGDLAIAQWLAAFGEATLTGMLAAILVAFRPEWLATYSDRLYLPERDATTPLP